MQEKQNSGLTVFMCERYRDGVIMNADGHFGISNSPKVWENELCSWLDPR